MLFLLKKIKFYTSPYFPIRYLMLRDIKYINKKYLLKGKALDVGCGEKPFKKEFCIINEYIGIDFKGFSTNKDLNREKPDFYFSSSYLNDLRLPFKSESFENVFSFQVLEHHKNYTKLLEEMIRVAKSSGNIMITAPFLYPLHEIPNDFQRITPFGIMQELKKYNVEITEIIKEGSLFTTFSMLMNESLNQFASKNNFYYFLSIFIFLPLLIFQYISLTLDKFIKIESVFCNYLILIRKK